MEEGEVMAPEHENTIDGLDMMMGEDPETSAHNDLPETEYDWCPFYQLSGLCY